MYIVRHRITKQVIHINPAPVSQGLGDPDVYHGFDAQTMEVGRGELQSAPEHFHVDQQGWIVPWTLKERADAGVLKLEPEQKVQGDQIVEKTLAEKVADGVVKLLPTQVIDGDQIREMTDAEKTAAGLVPLDPKMKVVGGKIIAPKSRAELARDGLVKLAPDEKLSGDAVIKLTPRQMLEEKRYDLDQYKAAVLAQHVQANLEARRQLLPDHELLYAAIGAVSPERVEECRAVVARFVKDLDETKAALQKARNADEVDAVPPPGTPGPVKSPGQKSRKKL